MKAALIGYGYWGKIIRRYIEQNKNFELVRICTQEDVAEEKEFFTKDLQDILANQQIEAAFVCTPIATHFEICKSLIMSGKHVFCEKPTVRGGNALEELLRLSKDNHRILYTDYIYTESPSIIMMKELLPQIGDISDIEGEISQFGNFYPQDTVFEVLGVHLFSVLAYLISDMEIQTCDVFALKGMPFYGGRVQMTVNDRIRVLFMCNLLNTKKIRMIKIYGTTGSILFDMMDKEATLRMQKYTQNSAGIIEKGESRTWNFDESNNLSTVIQKFHEAIINETNSQNEMVAQGVNMILEMIQ